MPDTEDEIFADLQNLPIPAESFYVNVPEVVFADAPNVIGEENKKLFSREMQGYDAYLSVLHSSFKYATSINAVTRLVSSALTVQRQRRAALEHALKLNQPTQQKEIIEYDIMGNVVKKA